MIIAISGIDGSGKSTQIRLLVEHLSALGHHPTALWFRPGYSNELNALRSLVRRAAPGALPRAEETVARQRAFDRPVVRWSWYALAWLDLLVQYGARVRALDRLGRVVLCDRYVDDGLLDLHLRFPDVARRVAPVEHLARRVVARPHAAFLLMLSHDEMVRRLDAKDEPFPEPPVIRHRRYDAYREMSLQGSRALRVIDASSPADQVHAEIVADLERQGLI